VAGPAWTLEDLRRCEGELQDLVPREQAPIAVRETALTFNAQARQVRREILGPARALLEGGDSIPDEVAECISRTIAELAFWRRVLCRVYWRDLGAEASPADFLLRYLLS
jgi:hypothetical protein